MQNKRLEIEDAVCELVEITVESHKKLIEDLLIRMKTIKEANQEGDGRASNKMQSAEDLSMSLL